MGRAQQLDVEVVVEGIAGRLAQLDPRLRRRRRELADQIERACMSLMLNLGESLGNHAGNRRLRLETAAGSATELRRALRFAAIWGHVDGRLAEELDRDLDRVLAMLWRLRQRCA
jgi:four helix bundle protein